ncbi:hypothetical protein KR009_003105 [Drosophila setifemur]|nr:hypothetical protein KR009_003105 [Drosophila setifemur]
MSGGNVICIICSERFGPVSSIRAGMCGHAFHDECLERWQELSRTCPICRCADCAFIHLYLDFEESAGAAPGNGAGSGSGDEGGSGSGNGSGNGSGSGNNQSQNQSSSSNLSSSSIGTEYGGMMREYENLLYETGVYQDEIEYLNSQIGALTLRNSQLKHKLNESDSE